jgi:hypothetical protein
MSLQWYLNVPCRSSTLFWYLSCQNASGQIPRPAGMHRRQGPWYGHGDTTLFPDRWYSCGASANHYEQRSGDANRRWKLVVAATVLARKNKKTQTYGEEGAGVECWCLCEQIVRSLVWRPLYMVLNWTIVGGALHDQRLLQCSHGWWLCTPEGPGVSFHLILQSARSFRVICWHLD